MGELPERSCLALEDDEIDKLFLAALENSSQDTDEVREVFSTLIKTTLRYRDQMLEHKGVVVTVEDVRTALKWLVPCLATGQVPKTDDKLRLDLLKIWVDELKRLGKPHVYLT
ncbi:MAG: hypothetical protein DRH11_13585 [Deltaproteobacteria bacterium]|nr:MAG: hypothetical protein DRH11_13585 [Deltaproteobacteria bacterium]